MGVSSSPLALLSMLLGPPLLLSSLFLALLLCWVAACTLLSGLGCRLLRLLCWGWCWWR